MVEIIVTTRDGQERVLEAADNEVMMYSLRDNNADVEAVCGGCCSCATCHIFVDSQWMAKLPDPSEEEKALLEELTERRETSRLSCQLDVSPDLDGIRITVAPADI